MYINMYQVPTANKVLLSLRKRIMASIFGTNAGEENQTGTLFEF